MKTILLFLFIFACTSTFSQVAKAPLKVVVMTKSRTAIPNDKVTFIGKESGKEFVGITDIRGQFMVHLPAGDTYGIKIDVIGEELDHSTFEVPELPPGKEFNVVTLEIAYEIPTSVVLEDLHFSSGSARIQSSSFQMLNELADYLKRKKSIRIRIDGHTDNNGSEASNLTLSEQRANAVRDYLIEQGVSPSALVAKGFGETKPIEDNATPQGQAANRRTEIRIL